MIQLKPYSRSPSLAWPKFTAGPKFLPTFAVSEDFEGTEALLRKEIAEGWQKPKKELD